jgi:hypothetical protein
MIFYAVSALNNGSGASSGTLGCIPGHREIKVIERFLGY